jgi:hypothetical protein
VAANAAWSHGMSSGEELRQLRSGFSQGEIARVSGVPRFKISLAENNHAVLTAREIQSIKEAVFELLRRQLKRAAAAFVGEQDGGSE